MDQFTKDEAAPELISISDRQRSTAICCSGTRVLSCQAAAVHPAALGVPSLTLPNGVQAEFKNNIAGDLNTYHYESADAYAIIVYNPSRGAMNGHARFANSKGFVLEYCGDAGHVWKEMDMKNIQQREEKPQRDFILRKNKIMDMRNNIQQKNLSASQLRKVRFFSSFYKQHCYF